MILTKEELNKIKQNEVKSIYKKISRVNSFLHKDWSRYWEAFDAIKNGHGSWSYSIPISDIKFFELYVRQHVF